MFHVVMEWKYGDVLVTILDQNTVAITAVDWESQSSLENAASNPAQVRYLHCAERKFSENVQIYFTLFFKFVLLMCLRFHLMLFRLWPVD